MKFFNFGRKTEIIDLSGKYKKAHEVNGDEADGHTNFSGSIERRKRLAKRIADMTAKLEDLSKQIHNLSQRIEVLEKKSKTDFDN